MKEKTLKNMYLNTILVNRCKNKTFSKYMLKRILTYFFTSFLTYFSDEDSVVAVGVAGKNLPNNKYPGKFDKSVGWVSRDGKLYYNERTDGNMSGTRAGQGSLLFPLLTLFSLLFGNNYLFI